MVAPPVALTISIDACDKAPPASLVDRLSTPPASPTKDEVMQRDAVAAKLHAAHLDEIVGRAHHNSS